MILPTLGAVCGCTFAPVYGDQGVATQKLVLNYGTPNTRIEQVIYQELSLRLGGATAPDAPVVNIVATRSAFATAFSQTRDPAKPNRVTVNAIVTVTKNGAVLKSFARKASAEYTTNGQVLADNAAVDDAGERAAKAVAETIRLSLIALLMGQNQPQ
jgi:hypothetical protein